VGTSVLPLWNICRGHWPRKRKRDPVGDARLVPLTLQPTCRDQTAHASGDSPTLIVTSAALPVHVASPGGGLIALRHLVTPIQLP
jgi:hypothetical protein